MLSAYQALEECWYTKTSSKRTIVLKSAVRMRKYILSIPSTYKSRYVMSWKQYNYQFVQHMSGNLFCNRSNIYRKILETLACRFYIYFPRLDGNISRRISNPLKLELKSEVTS